MNRCKYQDQNTEITLRDGLDEYFKANPHLLLPDHCSEDAARFFKDHDFIHVVFGCTTSFLDEARTDWWTILGTDIGLFGYLRRSSNGAIKELYRDMKQKMTPEDRTRIRAEIKRDVWAALAIPLAMFKRTRKMTKKWSWEGGQQYLDLPLRDIRREFNIKVFE